MPNNAWGLPKPKIVRTPGEIDRMVNSHLKVFPNADVDAIKRSTGLTKTQVQAALRRREERS